MQFIPSNILLTRATAVVKDLDLDALQQSACEVSRVYSIHKYFWCEAAGDLTSKRTRRCLCAAVQALVCNIFLDPTV